MNLHRKAFLLGAGGHAKMVIEAIRTQNNLEIICCLASDAGCGKTLLGVPIQEESRELLVEFQSRGFVGFVAVGDNRLRKRLFNQLQDLGLELPSAIANSAYVSSSATIGQGTVVMPGAIIGADAIVGNGCILNCGCSIDHDNRVNDFVHIGPGSHLAGNVRVKEGAFLGVGTSVIPERTIGAWTIVGAGAVVLGNVPPNEVWVGCPARQLPSTKAFEIPHRRISA